MGIWAVVDIVALVGIAEVAAVEKPPAAAAVEVGTGRHCTGKERAWGQERHLQLDMGWKGLPGV